MRSFVVTLLNWVDNADRVREAIKREVSSAVVYVACPMAGPGHLLHHALVNENLGAAQARRFID